MPGRAAEELVYGADEISTINQRRLVMARRIVTKLVATAAMSDAPAVGPRTLTQPYASGSRTLIQIFPRRVRHAGCARTGEARRVAVVPRTATEPEDRVAACSCEGAVSSWARVNTAVPHAAPGNTWQAERLHGSDGVGMVRMLPGG